MSVNVGCKISIIAKYARAIFSNTSVLSCYSRLATKNYKKSSFKAKPSLNSNKMQFNTLLKAYFMDITYLKTFSEKK